LTIGGYARTIPDMTHRAVVLTVITLVFLVPAARTRAADPKPELLDVKKIWSAAPHSAFTDLLRHDNAWWCVFRESTAHIPGLDGKIRVLRSTDAQSWESAALVAEKGVDLRDPKLSVTPDGRLMLLIGGSIYDGAEPTPNRKRTSGHGRVSFSKDGRDWTAPNPIEGIGDQQWLWRVTWHKGVGYGTVYSMGKRGPHGRVLTIWKTADGVTYEKLAEPNPPVDLSEATIRFLPDDTMVVLLRGEAKDRHAWVGHAMAPYQSWEWKDGGHSAGGPEFIVLNDGRMFYAGRDFDDKNKPHTVFGRMTLDALEPLITLPSGGDTSYAGIADAGDGTLRVSYYSSHEGGKTSIYLATIRVGAPK
jgi:hypothetical protein